MRFETTTVIGKPISILTPQKPTRLGLPPLGIRTRVDQVEIQLTMLGVVVRDMPTALRFYRLLGLGIPETEDAKRFVLHRMSSGVTIIFDTVFVPRYDSAYVAEERHGHGAFFEFYLGDDAAVDSKYAQLTEAGYHGRMAPEKTFGPYAAMVDDPDGNVVLLTSDNALGELC